MSMLFYILCFYIGGALASFSLIKELPMEAEGDVVKTPVEIRVLLAAIWPIIISDHLVSRLFNKEVRR